MAARIQGVSHLGLGQFTSIITQNGLMAEDYGLNITTGNSFTVALSLEGVRHYLEKNNLKLSELKVGVVGAIGNIGTVITEIYSKKAKSVVMIHRQSIDENQKFKDIFEAIKTNSSAELIASSDINDISDCDIIVLATNAVGQLLQTSQIKKNAIVLDISVPNNFNPESLKDRADIHYLQGGIAALPTSQSYGYHGLPCSPGYIFACMAETLMVGLVNYQGNYSVGPVNVDRVNHSINSLAKMTGVSLGELKTNSSF